MSCRSEPVGSWNLVRALAYPSQSCYCINIWYKTIYSQLQDYNDNSLYYFRVLNRLETAGFKHKEHNYFHILRFIDRVKTSLNLYITSNCKAPQKACNNMHFSSTKMRNESLMFEQHSTLFLTWDISHDSNTRSLSTFTCNKKRDKRLEISHEKELLL